MLEPRLLNILSAKGSPNVEGRPAESASRETLVTPGVHGSSNAINLLVNKNYVVLDQIFYVLSMCKSIAGSDFNTDWVRRYFV